MHMGVKCGLIVRIVQTNYTYLGEKLFGDCGKYRSNKFIHIINNCMPIDITL